MEDESKNFVGRIAQKAIIEKDGKVLVMRNRGRARWELPGGRLQVGETPLAGLAREIEEEFGIPIIVKEPIATGTFVLARTQEPHFFVIYRCELAYPERVLTPDVSEVEEMRWASGGEIAALDIWEVYKQALEEFFNRTYSVGKDGSSKVETH